MPEQLRTLKGGESKEVVNQDDDDSDWEYEYHETEMETFNVILDFSSSSNLRRKPKENNADPIPTQTTNPPDINPADQPSPLDEDANASSSDRIQILDLHTSNPLISYQSQLYTCAWTTTIGTDMILSPTTQERSPLLFTTRHKLLAHPARLTPHAGDPPSPPPPPPNPNDAFITPHAASDQPPSSMTTNSKRVTKPLDSRASLARQRQTAFLERLMAAKVARGETDQVTVHSQRRVTGTGWRSQQRAAAAEEAEAEAEAEAGAEAEAEAEAAGMEEGFSAEEGYGGEISRQGRNETPKRARIGRPRGRGRGRAANYRNALFETPRPQSGDPLTTLNPNTSSTSNPNNKDQPPPQQIGSSADQHDAIIIPLPPAEVQAHQDQGTPSAKVHTATTPTTQIDEDVIMQDV